MTKILAVVTAFWWLGVAAVVLNHNVAPFRSAPFVRQSLRWPDLTRPTPHFSWHQPPAAANGQVRIPAGETRRFTLTLPRGFRVGEVFVLFEENAAAQEGIRLRGQGRPGKTVEVVSVSPAWLVLEWADLQFRGHSTNFELTNVTAEPISLRTIEVIVR